MKMFEPEGIIKKGCWTTVEKGTFRNTPVVRKRYNPPQRARYHAEKNNLFRMDDTDFCLFVRSIAADDFEQTLIFPYAEGRSGYDALQTQDPQITLCRMLESMVEETMRINHKSHAFSSVSEGYKKSNNPFTYCILLTKSDLITEKQRAELKRLLNIPLPEPVWVRYDPELSNLIVCNDRVTHVDYESMSLQDNLYPLAYAAVHLEFAPIPSAAKKTVGNGTFIKTAKNCAVNSLCTNAEFESRMKLNMAEFC